MKLAVKEGACVVEEFYLIFKLSSLSMYMIEYALLEVLCTVNRGGARRRTIGTSELQILSAVKVFELALQLPRVLDSAASCDMMDLFESHCNVSDSG